LKAKKVSDFSETIEQVAGFLFFGTVRGKSSKRRGTARLLARFKQQKVPPGAAIKKRIWGRRTEVSRGSHLYHRKAEEGGEPSVRKGPNGVGKVK